MKDSFQNRWFIIFTAAFSVLAFLLAYVGTRDLGFYEISGFGRTTASLINLVLMLIPLMGLMLGSITISAEREKGTLHYLLSHPISKKEIFVGKYAGLIFSLIFTITIGFALGGIAIFFKSGTSDIGKYLLDLLITLILASCVLSIGMLISVCTKKISKSIGIAIFVWFFLIILSDLGIIGSVILFNLGIEPTFLISLLNPTEVYKILSVLVLSSRFEILGPVGIYILNTFGRLGSLAMLTGVLIVWSAAPLLGAYLHFCRYKREEV
ncbi:MAG: ABC transporter permease subunit [Candidatus Dadabacteria bacterium]|nr:ABC transporter permease subunit [Candidatus Dadabacteria bacterium]NIS07334.1 ABC transporter permease subunit [Candidatus Dadabacteria bacterium]NIV41278.1 ABC transporter permease subunit [Candidatus Dadabacteria bacterium]NIX14513.1 ABC transporter permease subunit [Candidatus Dadabacteria bacterium]NIY20971.1 ABC transporter permease subunit [Candidatus Dadabacteria bacterium]